MSTIGKLLRGLGWHKHRNADGIYEKDVADDPHKMEEVSFYLAFIKDRDANAVHKLMEKYMLMDLGRPRNAEAKMMLISQKVTDLPTKTKSKSKGD